MYLSPNLRRDFLDNLLKNSFEEFDKLLLEYKKIIKHRNKILKSISEWKCGKEEIKFWDQKFIESATLLYKYRIVNFFKESIIQTLEYFSWKIENIEFIYET